MFIKKVKIVKSFRSLRTLIQVTCRVDCITVDDQPIYLVAVPGHFFALEQRQKNRLAVLKKQYKLIIFDESDWKKAGLEISDKKWLKPLTRHSSKVLATLLFSKIAELGGSIKSSLSLFDVLAVLESSLTGTKTEQIYSLTQQNNKLRSLLRLQHLRQTEPTLKPCPELTRLSEFNTKSLLAVENLSNEIIQILRGSLTITGPSPLLVKASKTITDSTAFFVASKLARQLKNSHEVSLYSENFFSVRDLKTFQVVWFAVSKGSNPIVATKELRAAVGSNMVIVHNLTTMGKAKSISSYLLLLNSKVTKYTRSRLVKVYSSKISKLFNLGSEFF